MNYIGKNSFQGTAITSIKFGKNIREVEENAFKGCTSLERVDLNYGCKVYRYSCFQNCTSLERIELPDRKCDMGTDIFAGCTSLEYAYLGKTTWLSNRSFSGCSNLKTLVADYICCDLSNSTLFDGCTSLRNFNIPDGVEKVTEACFQDTKLITVQNNIKYVGGWAVGIADEEQATASLSFRSGTTGIDAIGFVEIKTITSVTLPSTLKHFYGYFSGKVKKIYISDLEGYLKLEFTNYGPVTNISDGYQLYLNGSELKTLTIPSSITAINENAFYNCQSIETINLHNNVSKIGMGAFDKCNNIQYTEYKNGNYIGSIGGPVVLCSIIDKTQTTFEFAPNTKAISTTAFAGGSKIINLKIPESVENIGASAFNGMKSLISVTLPNSITSIPETAFAYCTALEEITIPDSVTTIYGGAFYSCTALKTVNFGTNSQLETIKNGYNTYSTNYVGAFEKTAIESITFPSTLKTIGTYAFSSCKNITSLTIGSSVTYIGYRAFEKCTGLETLTINGTSETEIGAYAFENCSGLKTANISVYFINTGAFSKCTSLTNLTLNEGLHQLAYSVFGYCTSLYSVTLPASLKYIQKDIFKNCSKLVELQNLSNTKLTKDDVPSVLTFRALGTQSEIFRQSDFVFFRDSAGVTYILAYEGSQTEVTLPTIAGGYELLEGAFKTCQFTKVTIPEGVTAIPDNAFASCSKLVEINLPSTIASISLKAFISCENITTFNISENNQNYICDGGIVYNRAKTQIVFVPFSVSGIVELPETITIIEKEAFDSIMNVTQLSMLGVTEIKVGGCCYMTSLKSIIVSSALTSIGRHAFAEDENFDTVYFKGTEEQWNAISNSDTTITKCTIYYYSETNPFEGENAVEEGNYWHFDTDGKTPIIWQVAE